MGRRLPVPADLFGRFLEVLPDAVLLLDGRFAIRMVNARAAALLGSSPDDLAGRNLLDFVDDEVDAARRYLTQASGTTQPLPGKLYLKSMNGGASVHGYASVLPDGPEQLIALRCVEQHRPSTILRALRDRLLELNADLHREKRLQTELQEAAREREILLGELHHRVRNHLQITSSLISLQMKGLGSDPARELLLDTQARIQALGLVHNALYSVERVDQIELIPLLSGLAQSVVGLFDASDRVTIRTSLPPWRLAIANASPLALLVTEAISNAIKHAFPKGRTGTIALEAWDDGDRRILRISDDGVGMIDERPRQRRHAIGLDLIRSLAGQLKAHLDIDDHAGVEIRLTFAAATDWR